MPGKVSVKPLVGLHNELSVKLFKTQRLFSPSLNPVL
jgi:hypothetical protein